jgi:hypothetical protein
VRNKKIPAGATVTHEAATDTFHYSAPGHGYSIKRENPLKVAATAGALVAVPAFVGAVQNEVFGTVAAGLGGSWSGILGGLALGATIGGYKSYKASNENPILGIVGGIAGAAGGAVLYPLLKQPGLWGGFEGAAVATGLAAVGVGIYCAITNHNHKRDAIATGWNRDASNA